MSQESPPGPSSKKRKSPFDATPPSSTHNKRRKSIMSLNQESLDKFSQSSCNNSFLKMDDEDTRSITSISVSSEQVLKNNPERDYTSVATNFGINVACAKRFHSCLSNQPSVAIVQYVPVKKESLSPLRLDEPFYAVSPVFSAKKRGKRKRKDEEQGDTSSTVKYNGICDESATSNLSHNETSANTESLVRKKFTKRAKQNVENYLETLKRPCKVENDVLSESSLKEEPKLPMPAQNTLHESENEFEISECKYNEESTEKESDKPKMVTNPFSINEQARTNSQISKKKESFWTTNFGSVDASLKKKKFIDHFKIENDSASDALTENKHEHQNGLAQENEQVEKRNGEIASNGSASKNASRRRNRIYIPGDEEDTDSDIEKQTYDSLSVNCQYFNSNNEDSLKQNDNQMSPLMSFGGGPGQNEDKDEEESDDEDELEIEIEEKNKEKDEDEDENGEKYNDVEKEQNISIEDDIIDITTQSPEPHLIIDQETTLTTNNLANEVDEDSSDDLSGDLFDSPTKSPSPSDGRLVIDLTPTSSVESSPIKDVPTRRKGKPKIKSDTKLSTPIYNIAARKKLQTSGLETSPSSPVAKSNGVRTPSRTDDFDQSDLVSQQTKANSSTPTTGRRASIEQVRCNLNNEESVKDYQNGKSKIISGTNVEESFDKICQDLTNLSGTESITLYKGSEDTETSANDVVSNNNTQKKEGSTAVPVFNNNVCEMPSLTKTALETSSTKTSTRVPQSKLSGSSEAISQQKTPMRITRSTVNSNTTSQGISALRGFPRIPRKDSRLNKTASPVTLSENRDPRLNRSLSPNKPLSTPATDVRVTRSSSQKSSPGIFPADPRLTRGQSRPRTSDPTSPTNISPTIVTKQAECGEEVKIVDPRLRKRKEREEAEKAKKLAEELAKSNDNISSSEPAQPTSLVSKFGQSSPVEPERKRSVFQRLGCKELSPEKNVLLNIIKSSKPSSPTKSHRSFDDDDDNISLHAHLSDFDDSDEDDKDSSPRHRKFEPERKSNVSSAEVSSTMLNAPQQQRLSAKQRLGLGRRVGEPIALSNRRAPISASNAATTLAPPLPPATATTLVNPLAKRLGPRVLSEQSRQIPAPPEPARATYTNVPPPPPDFSRPPPSFGINGSFNMDSFVQMNNQQMEHDQDNLMMDTDGQDVYFDADDNKPSEFDHRSILDNQLDTSKGIGLSNPKFTFFNKQCFRLLREGKCKTKFAGCNYQHQDIKLFRTIKTHDARFTKAIIQTSIENNFDYFLDNVWKDVLPIIKDDAFTIFEQLYEIGKRSPHFVRELVLYNLSVDTYTVNDLLKKLAPIIEENDFDTVDAICNSIKNKLDDGFCWETIKCICAKAAPPKDIVEMCIMQCLRRKKQRNHILEVSHLIKTKMLASDRNKISASMLKQFNDLVARQNPTTQDTETLSTMPLMNVTNNLTNGQSFQHQPLKVPRAVVQPSAKTTKSTIKKAVSQTPKSPDDTANASPNENQAQTPVGGEIRNFAQYKVQKHVPPEPVASRQAREVAFWKFYAAVDDIFKGLAHKDYDFVWEQLDKCCREPMPTELFKRACYQVMCKDVKKSEEHISEVLKRAAKKSSEQLTGLLFEIAMQALVDLGDNGLWVMAAELLKNMSIFQPEVPHAVFVLISAEIYLANSKPYEALCLLQRTKVIRTNRDEWLVTDSKKADEKHRNKVVFILLQALSHVEPEKAVFLFKELMADQYIYYYPIDLSSYVDKLTLLLFLNKRLNLAVEIVRLVIGNDMTFQKPTYQEILSRLLPVDDVLVNQVLDYAVHLGYYPDIKIREGFTTLIIDMNYTEEEIYLMLNRLIRQLTINLGPTIPRLKSSHLKVTLVFEDIPTGKRLYEDETMSSIDLNKNRQMRTLIADILSKRFTPAIKLSQGRADRFCKIMSRTLVHYLKHWHEVPV